MDYFIKVNVALALIYCFYYLTLRQSAYFSANRIFLLSGLGLAFILPALGLKIAGIPGMFTGLGRQIFSSPDPVSGNVSPAESGTMLPGVVLDPVSIEASGGGLSSFNAWEWVVIAYACIAGMALLRIVYFLYHLLLLYRSGRVIRRKGYRLVLLRDPQAPAFSFFSIIFISSADLRRKDNWILRHELVHVNQLHSVDILLSEIVKALLWINPFAYLYQRAMRSVNEYAADAIVPEQSRDRYAQLMYNYAFLNDTRSLQNTFFNKNLLKRRISMLYQKKTLKMRTNYLLAVPMLAILLALTATSKETRTTASPAGALPAGPPPTSPQPESLTASSLIRVNGTVTDIMNKTIAGVSVFVEGTPGGTATDMTGRFQLDDIPSNARLRFSMIGYESQTVSLGNNSTVNIRLRRKREVLDSMVLVSYASFGQKTVEKSVEETPEREVPVYSFASVEQMPAFPGGKKELVAYIARHYNYPTKARDNNVEGIVEIGFIVDEEGNVTQPEILKGIGSGCDEEALRVVKTLPKWEPAEQNGVKVAVYYVLPLTLRVQ